MQVCSDRRFTFHVSRQRVWAGLCEVRRYPTWWPWLRDFDGTTLAPGARWHCGVQPPLPYRLAFDLLLQEVVESSVVTAGLSGDLQGDARLELTDHPEGCELRLTSALSPTSRPLAAIAFVAAPIARFGHDWVLESGARQFARTLAV